MPFPLLFFLSFEFSSLFNSLTPPSSHYTHTHKDESYGLLFVGCDFSDSKFFESRFEAEDNSLVAAIDAYGLNIFNIDLQRAFLDTFVLFYRVRGRGKVKWETIVNTFSKIITLLLGCGEVICS